LLIKKFADDTKIGHTVSSQAEREELQRALNLLCDWATKWGMKFNLQKCKVMHLGHNNPRQEYSMGGQILGVTEEERDIGVIVTKNLKTSTQCMKAAKTAQTVLAQLTRSFHYRDRHVFVRLYIQYVRPHLEFSVPSWSPWQETDKECLEKVQKRAIRMVSGLKSESYEDRLKELGLTTLEERRHQIDMAQVYKILNGKDRVDWNSWFRLARDGPRETRRAADPLNLQLRPARLEVRRNFFSNRVVESWNSIPAELKRAKNLKGFKEGYKKLRKGLNNEL